VNRGIEVIGAGLVANDKFAFAGSASTYLEIGVIDAIFRLRGTETEQNFYVREDRGKLFDDLS